MIQQVSKQNHPLNLFSLDLVQVNNTTTTTPPSIVQDASWGFDNDVNDLYRMYNGVLMNGASYSSPTYFGYGANLLLNSSLNQFVNIPSPFFNLSYTSFTVEAWIFVRTFTGDNGIFSQCQCSSCQDQCLHLIIRNARMYMGFTLDDLVGVNTVPLNSWTHIAYVYDYSTRTQSIYLQGVLDNSKTSAGPYQGQSGSIVIGSSHLSSSSFNGFMDNVKLTTRAKSSKEIMDAANIVVYFSFDSNSLGEDTGPNEMNGTVSNAGLVAGRVGQGLAFSGSLSYLMIPGFFQLGLGNRPFSFALWIYPYSVNGGTLIHKVSVPPTTGWCLDMLGLTAAGQISFVINSYGQLTGPFISTMRWTHVVCTYSTTNGQIIYINGVEYIRGTWATFSTSGNIDWLIIGYNFGGCTVSPVYGGYFLGAIDEFYVFRRELTANDVQALANP